MRESYIRHACLSLGMTTAIVVSLCVDCVSDALFRLGFSVTRHAFVLSRAALNLELCPKLMLLSLGM